MKLLVMTIVQKLAADVKFMVDMLKMKTWMEKMT